ncbi:MAG: zinc/iron-chelating domain-containing protein [Deltaproteobacteria bacterium]|nr:MAG: zinc/iron-chelating domain-containing protein [Deltaproteobacteria bacterium]
MVSKKNNILKNYPPPSRLSFPEDEKQTDWLSGLLDAYYTADRGIYKSILKEERKGRKLACAKGCSTCCTTHVTIPVYPLEILGIYWFVILKTAETLKKKLKSNLELFSHGKSCPFLVDGSCGIHPMRPLACRHFNVFSKSCEKGEDPYYTRKGDVLIPDENAKNKALSLMVFIHGIIDRNERKEFVRSGKIHSLARNMQEIDWHKLAERISL